MRVDSKFPPEKMEKTTNKIITRTHPAFSDANPAGWVIPLVKN